MSDLYRSYLPLTGRLLLCVIFLLSGINKIIHWDENLAYMAAHGMPSNFLLLALATLAELCGGLGLLVGFQTRLAALGLFLYLIPTTLIFHHFWTLQGAEQQMQLINFLKNLAVMGGLLECTALGAGAISLDASFAHTKQQGGFWSWAGSPYPY